MSPITISIAYYNIPYLFIIRRSISTSSPSSKSEDGFFSKLFVRRIEPTKESHSTMLSDTETIYEMQTHQVKPAFLNKYLSN